jgi:hypothetical protein
MKSAKFIVQSALCTALLIGVQFVLSGIAGVELVTFLFLCFCYKYGIKQGVLVANAFSILRCFVFGFFPNVMILYLIYYNLFALVFGLIGKTFKGEYTVKKHICIVCVAVLMTAMFTMLDNVLYTLMHVSSLQAAKVYFLASFYTLVPHLVCTFCTTLLLFRPLIKLFR